MVRDVGNETYGEEVQVGSCLLWFFWGITMSITTICSVVFLALFVASTALNVYLGWQVSGYEVVVRGPGPAPTEYSLPGPEALVGLPTRTPSPTLTSTPTPAPTESPLDSQVSTLAAIATDVALSATPISTPILLPTETLLPTPISTPAAPIPINQTPGADIEEDDEPQAISSTSGEDAELPQATLVADSGSVSVAAEPETSSFAPPAAAASSNNSYQLIPIEGERESRPAAEHGDLNIKLRDPQPIEVERSLVDVGAGVDANAPDFSAVFEPNIKATYTVHNWDWGCNCKSDLIDDGSVVLAGIETTPGEPVYIPPKGQDIYDGKYYAVVLYAAEDTLTFVYARAGSVVRGYTIHYLGLQTDPNLIKLFEESSGNQLPGLTLDTPVGVATDELIVAIRDNGTFLDARSQNDWWD